MAAMCRLFFSAVKRNEDISYLIKIPVRYSNTVHNHVVEKSRSSPLSHMKIKEKVVTEQTAPRDYKYVYPEFLPKAELRTRDKLTEKMERLDMLKRRAVIDIPEFYVGTIMAVTVSDQYAPGKKNRFVGICIERAGNGLRANFTLRNVVDTQGIEIRYDMYSPIIQKIEVLRLEKRLDEELFYLRDAPAEYSTYSFDFEPVNLPPNAPVPVNTIKVKLGPRPWHERWERKKLQGVQDLGLPERFYERAKHPQIAKPFDEHDIMKKYRKTINDVETEEIMSEVYQGVQNIEQDKIKQRRGQKNGRPNGLHNDKTQPKK